MEVIAHFLVVYLLVALLFFGYLRFFGDGDESGISDEALALLWPTFAVMIVVEAVQSFNRVFFNKNR